MMLSSGKALWAITGFIVAACALADTAEEVRWDFDDGLEGWGASTESSMDAEVYSRNGEIMGAIRGQHPYIDSPWLNIDCSDRHHLVVRMSYQGQATMGRAIVRSSAGRPGRDVLDDYQASWAVRPNLTVISASSNTSVMAHATDGSKYSVWTSKSSSDEWLIFDAGAFVPVSRVEVDITRDANAPRNMRLQKSLDPTGKYSNVAVFAITSDNATSLNSTDYTHAFDGFRDSSRFWRLYLADNFGGSHVKIREVRLYGPEQVFEEIPFTVVPDGRMHTYYIPIHQHFQGLMSQLRFHPVSEMPAVVGLSPGSVAPHIGESFGVDFIAIVKAPTITKVEGCLNKYHPTPTVGFGQANLTAVTTLINDVLPQYSTFHGTMDAPYATTYNCYQSGGQVITISGRNFGSESPTNVTVNGAPCAAITALEERRALQCVLPPGSGQDVTVSVVNARYKLSDSVYYLSYQVAPPMPTTPVVSNIAACSVDLTWSLRGDIWDAMTITGYSILIREDVGQPSVRTQEVVVGNVTMTTINGLKPDTQYEFSIAALAENQDANWQQLDLYGRRELIQGGLIGPYSKASNVTATLLADLTFAAFDANSTLDFGPAVKGSLRGPTNVTGGEGHYGLVLLGDANVQGCNGSYACCDSYNATVGPSSCAGSIMCSAVGSLDLVYQRGRSSRATPSNVAGGEKVFRAYQGEGTGGSPSFIVPQLPCGPALRLTSSHARFTGAAWYGRQLEVREGFDTSFSFQITSPSLVCDVMDDEYTHCRSRGADGFAFVVQVDSHLALGHGGMGLGYEGINNSLAVEFDTYHNYELLDPYENHVSVQSRGWRASNSANHSFSLASATGIPDIADGRRHRARIRYTPQMDEAQLLTSYFQASGHSADFFVNADFFNGGLADWGTGVGLLSVYFDDMFKPVLTTPLNLDATLNLNRGRAWVGFTAATGSERYQVHDILDWTFTSLRIDPPYSPSPVVDGVGAFSCADVEECVHP